MVSLTCSTIRDGGVTLVTAQVANTDRRRRVRLRHDADGPVWPPRSEGVPVEGWDGDTFECVLAADERRAVGYATPAPVEDPLAVAATEPVDADPADGASTADLTPAVTPTPDGVVRALGPPEPPRDAVPDPEPVDAGDSTPTDPATERATDGSATARSAGNGDAAPSFAAADAWFSSVERRLDAAESLSETTAVSAATPAVRRLGGLDGVRETAAELDTDAERLRRLAARATDLADRAESASLPVETLDRLA